MADAALIRVRSGATMVGLVDAERVDVLERALEAVGPDDSEARARLLALLAAELHYLDDPTPREEFSAEAVAIARRLGDPRVLVYTVSLRLGTTGDGTANQESTDLIAE